MTARQTTRWFLAAVLVCLLANIGCSDATTHDWPERSDPATGISLRLSPETQTIKTGGSPRFIVLLVNGGKKEVVLVEPGSCSDRGWRTPVIEWSRQKREHGPRCGNINALEADEVFTIAPGQSHQLNSWVGKPYLSGLGRYRIALRYTNDPNMKWSGVPLGNGHDPKAMEAIRRSTAVSVVSNTVEVIVEW